MGRNYFEFRLIFVCLFACFLYIESYGQILLEESSSVLDINSYNISDVVAVGDINGDDVGDIAISNLDDSTISIFLGKKNNEFEFDSTPLLSIPFNNYTVEPVFGGRGDLNGDGVEDLVISFPQNKGVLNVYFGGQTISNVPDQVFEGLSANGQYGYSFSIECDLNNDGFNDLVVGEPFRTYGYAYVYLGGENGVSIQIQSTLSFGDTYHRFGTLIKKGGDFNNDGFDDVIITSKKDNKGWVKSGPFDRNKKDYPYCVFYGTSNGLEPQSRDGYWNYNHYEEDPHFGTFSQAAGDINNDGYDDVIFGDISANRVDIMYYLGSSSGLGRSYKRVELKYHMAIDKGLYSNYIIKPFDFNNDSLVDLGIVYNAYRYYNNNNSGFSIYLNNGNGFNTNPSFKLKANSDTIPIFKVFNYGDVNDDGYDDVLLLDTSFTNGVNKLELLTGRPYLDIELTSDTVSKCHIDNEFDFLLSVQGDYSSIIWNVEGKDYPSNQLHFKHSFSKPGNHKVYVQVIDDNGFFVKDSLEVLSQHYLTGGVYSVGNNQSIQSIVQLHDSLKCGYSGDLTFILHGDLDSSLIIHSPQTYGESSLHFKSAAGNKASLPGLSLKEIENVSFDSIQFDDQGRSEFSTLYDYFDFRNITIFQSQKVQFNECDFYLIPFWSNLMVIDECEDVSVTNSTFNGFVEFSSNYDRYSPITDEKYSYKFSYLGAVPNVSESQLIIYRSKNISIERNLFYTPKEYVAIWSRLSEFIKVNYNKIDAFSQPQFLGDYGITPLFESEFNKNIEFCNNHIFGRKYGKVSFDNTDVTGPNEFNLVSNNNLGGVGPEDTTSLAFIITASNNFKIYHNTCRISLKVKNWWFERDFNEGFDIKNNIFLGDILIDTTSLLNSFDYNVYAQVDEAQFKPTYYIQVAPPINEYLVVDKFKYPDLKTWTELTGNDAHSLSFDDLEFESWYSHRVLNLDSLNAFVPTLPEVTTDIYGNERDNRFTFPGPFSLSYEDVYEIHDDGELTIFNHSKQQALSYQILDEGQNIIEEGTVNYPSNRIYLEGNFDHYKLVINNNDDVLSSESIVYPLLIKSEVVTAVQNHQATNKVYLYPNPTSDYLFLNGMDYQGMLDVYDVNGKLIKQVSTLDNRVLVVDLNPGVYFISFENKFFRFVKK